MAHLLAGAPLLVTTSNGAPPEDAPLVCLDRRTSSKKILVLMAHHGQGAPLVSIFFELVRLSKHTNGASRHSAPLLVVTSNGAPVEKCATNVVFLLYFLFPFLQNY